MTPDPCEIKAVNTDYPNRSKHRGHTVSVNGWNDKFVMLLIRSGDKTVEALITPAQLHELAEAAKKDIHKW